jgi:hypothetical protein
MSIKILITFLLIGFIVPIAFTQSVNTEFGKNRVQYHDFEWWKYETRDFIVYWYNSGKNIGESVVQMAELDHEEIRSLMEYRITDRIEILVYTDLTDLKQSNIGKDDVFVNTAGATTIVDNKMFVYFNGDHNHLREQIREGIARIYLNYMMFGGNIQEIVQNAVWLNLPTWFTEGLVSYVGEEWNTELDNQLRDGILSGKFNSFEDLAAVNPRLAGHSFWYFIAQNYGKSTVSNLLYLTRINRSVDNGFLYVLGTPFYRVSKGWFNHYQQHYIEDANVGNSLQESLKIDLKNKYNTPVNNISLSPDGQQIAYVTNEIGKKSVYIQNITTNKRTLIFRDGYKNQLQETDYNYPIVAWLPNNQDIAVIYEKRDDVKIYLHNINGEKSKTIDLPNKFDRILSIDFIDDKQVILSAVVDGFSNIFLFDIIGHAMRPITSDYHDDLYPIYATINGTKGVIFSSNRDDSLVVLNQNLDSLLPIKSFDLYFVNLDAKKGGELVRLTNTPYANESYPQRVNDRYYSYLSNETGIYNRYTGYIDTAYAYSERVYILKDGKKELVVPRDSLLTTLPEDQIDTTFIREVHKPKGFSFANSNYNRSIMEQNTSSRSSKVGELVFNNGEYQVYIHDLKAEAKETPVATHFIRNNLKISKLISKEEVPKTETPVIEKTEAPIENVPQDTVPVPTTVKEARDTNKIDIDNYFFQSEFEDEEAVVKKDTVKPKTVKVVIDNNSGTKVQDAMKLSQVPSNQAPIKFKRSRITPYQTAFRSEFVTTQLDNSQLFGGMQPTVNDNITGGFPSLGVLAMINIEDLFEDYRLRVGLRIPVTFNGMEYFTIFDDKSKLLDKRYEFYRSKKSYESASFPLGGQMVENAYDLVSNIGQVQLRYPLDIHQSLRGTAMLRLDKLVIKSEELSSLSIPNANEQRIGMRLEYVFDNTIEKSLNIRYGSLLKVSAEVHNRFNLNVSDSTYFEGSTGLLGLVGFDARHYQKLDKHSILAFRLTSYASFGSNKILYFLGGVNNWIDFPPASQISTDIIPIANENYAYQAVVANLRGFDSNIRNGSNFALANIELRVPVVKYFTKKTITNNFMRNLQMVGFFDIGTAWEGISPFNDDNPLNTTVIRQPNSPLTVTVNYFRNPVVFGYGYGFRSTLFGYYLKLDFAWGVETGMIDTPKTYLSIGMDF